jgi:hypothetical protein
VITNEHGIERVAPDEYCTSDGVVCSTKEVKVSFNYGERIEITVNRPNVRRMIKKIMPSKSGLENFVKKYFPELQIDLSNNHDEVINQLYTQTRLVELVTCIAAEHPAQIKHHLSKEESGRKFFLLRWLGL